MYTTDVTRDMRVLAWDGVVLGKIEEVWCHTASHGSLPLSRHLFQDYGPIKGTVDLLKTAEGDLVVRLNAATCVARTRLTIPLSAVAQVTPSGDVVLNAATQIVAPQNRHATLHIIPENVLVTAGS